MKETPGPGRLTALDATLLVMGGIIGVGIFFTPHLIAQRAYEPWAFLSVWVFGGMIALCAAFTFAELGATFPRSGGWFVYLRRAFGPLPAFLFAWVVLFVVSTGALAAITDFCVLRLHDALPELVPAAGTAGNRAVGVGIVLFLTAVTMTGVKRAALLQNVCMVVKLAALAALILAGLVFVTTGEASVASIALDPTPDPTPEPGYSVLGGMTRALLPVFFAFGGWQMICYIAPHVERPERVLPRAIVLGVGGVVVVYVLANLSYLSVLGIDGIATDPGFAATIAKESLGPRGERILSAGMAVSALGICAVNIITVPWLYVAMAEEGLFFRGLGALHAGTGAPVLALGLQALIVLAYYFLGTMAYLVDSVVFVEWIFHGLVAWALLRLRRRQPDLPRPFRSPFYPLAPLVYLLAALVVVVSALIQTEAVLKLTGLGTVALGVAVFYAWRAFVPREP